MKLTLNTHRPFYGLILGSFAIGYFSRIKDHLDLSNLDISWSYKPKHESMLKSRFSIFTPETKNVKNFGSVS